MLRYLCCKLRLCAVMVQDKETVRCSEVATDCGIDHPGGRGWKFETTGKCEEMLGRLRPALFSSLDLLLESTTSLLATPGAGWGLPMPWCMSSKWEWEDRAALLTHRWRSCNPGAAFVDQIQFKIRLGCSNKDSPAGDVETRPVSVTAESKQAKRAPTRPRWTIARQIEAHGILVLRECVQRRYRAGGVSFC